MKRNLTILAATILAGGLVLAAGTAAAPLGQQISPVAPKPAPAALPGLKQPTPAPVPIKCADPSVAGISVALLSTEVGKPGVEFPRDRVRVTFTVKNVGNLATATTAPPPGSGPVVLQLNAFRNETSLSGTVFGQLAAGGTVSAIVDDVFVHGQKTTYKGVLIYSAPECRSGNNEMSVTVDEVKLHPAQALPDLVAVNTWPNQGEYGYCKLSGEKLSVTVKNQGAGPAALSTLKVVMSNGTAKSVPVNGLPPGATAAFLFDLPANCFSSADCSFDLAVDDGGVVTESNEGNNKVHGRCFPY